MTLGFIDDYINKRLDENEEILIFTFYELRVKSNLSEYDVNRFLELAKIRLENIGYRIYFTGTEFVYKNATRIVNDNELLVAIKT